MGKAKGAALEADDVVATPLRGLLAPRGSGLMRAHVKKKDLLRVLVRRLILIGWRTIFNIVTSSTYTI